MSRDPRQPFFTPPAVTDAILPHLPLGGRIVEPSAGDGAIVRRLLAAGVKPRQIEAFEIERERAARVRRLRVRCHEADALQAMPTNVPRLVIMNPPFSLATEFVETALRWTQNAGTVASLLPLGMLGAEKRTKFWKRNPGDVYVLVPRPSFTEDRGNDRGDFAWMVFGPGRGGRWSRLEVAKQRARAIMNGGRRAS